MSRPEHAALCIIDDLRKADQQVLTALERSTDRRTSRDLKITHTNLSILINQMRDGKAVHDTARAYTEAALALTTRIGEQR